MEKKEKKKEVQVEFFGTMLNKNELFLFLFHKINPNNYR